MRVAILTPNARAGDAIGRGIVEKAGYFVDRGADVRIVLAETTGLHPALKPYVIRHSPNKTDAQRVLADTDVVVVEYSQFHPIFELLPLIADGSRRIVFDYHGVTPPHLASGNQRDALIRGQEWAALAGFADAIIVHSRHAVKELFEACDLPDERVHRLGLPIDDQWLSPGAPTVSLHQRLGLKSSRILLFVGRLAKNKQLPDLIATLPHLLDCDPPFHVVAVGPSGDCYEAERQYCRELAADLGVGDHLHFLGNVDEATLRDCYRSAAALVLPSRHEGFCLPAVEAMACGLPVIVSRATALPETVGAAGLCFNPHDAMDLAAQIRRVFSAPSQPLTGRIAVVTPAFGETIGGAERSLTLIANQFRRSGQDVEVFTIANPGNDRSIRVFDQAPSDDSRRAAALERCIAGDLASEPTFWQHTLRSEELVCELVDNDPWDAIIVGPFANGVTRDIVRRFGARVILAPCLHDEPAARLAGVREMFATVGGVLFHSAEERDLANVRFGFNHPNTAIIGTYVNVPQMRDAHHGQKIVGAERYVVFVGRRVAEKGLPELFNFARRYHAENPGRFRFAFIGAGPLPIPNEPWAVDLGRLSDKDKFNVIGGAAALVNLSPNESLSLVVLEAQACGVPVIVHAACPVMSGHVERGRGGWRVTNYDEFMRVLGQLANDPHLGTAVGQAGRDYVEAQFGNSEPMFTAIHRVIANLSRPMSEVMREAGIARAAQFSRQAWRHEFERVIEYAADQPKVTQASIISLTAQRPTIGSREWRVTLRHRSGAPLVPTGPGRSEILLQLRDGAGAPIAKPQIIPLRKMIGAGQSATFRTPIHSAQEITIDLGLRQYRLNGPAEVTWFGPHDWSNAPAEEIAPPFEVHCPANVARLLERAVQLARLPDDYVDVTTGRFAKLKRWLKAKLLHNFRVSYVDSLSRQQSRFNQQVIEALAMLAAEQVGDRESPTSAKSKKERSISLREAS